jgi:hypothetical protein
VLFRSFHRKQAWVPGFRTFTHGSLALVTIASGGYDVSMLDAQTIHCYYVDEAGDPALFDKKGRILVGTPGVSNCFFVGVAHLPNPQQAHRELEQLRSRLLGDPYFKGVPSMRQDAEKTARCFHAKDDLPEVRREIFKLLPRFGAKIQIAFRRKRQLAVSAQDTFRKLGRKINPNDVYDGMVKRLFNNMLHKADENRIVFALRGKTDRSAALELSLKRAQSNFQKTHGLPSDKPLSVLSGQPHQFAGVCRSSIIIFGPCRG